MMICGKVREREEEAAVRVGVSHGHAPFSQQVQSRGNTVSSEKGKVSETQETEDWEEDKITP